MVDLIHQTGIGEHAGPCWSYVCDTVLMGMPLKERLGHDIKRVEQELIAVKQAAVKPLGLTVPQYAALLVLSENPGISAAALARLCLVTPQTMATVLANLTDKGLVVREPHPWHHHILESRLTEQGQTVLANADAHVADIERCLADEFTAAERKLLRSLLARCSVVLSVQGRRLEDAGATATELIGETASLK